MAFFLYFDKGVPYKTRASRSLVNVLFEDIKYENQDLYTLWLETFFLFNENSFMSTLCVWEN